MIILPEKEMMDFLDPRVRIIQALLSSKDPASVWSDNLAIVYSKVAEGLQFFFKTRYLPELLQTFEEKLIYSYESLQDPESSSRRGRRYHDENMEDQDCFFDMSRSPAFFGSSSKFIPSQEKNLLYFMSKNLLTRPIMTFRLFARFFAVYKPPVPDGRAKGSEGSQDFALFFDKLQAQFLSKLVSASMHEVLCVQFVELTMDKIRGFVKQR